MVFLPDITIIRHWSGKSRPPGGPVEVFLLQLVVTTLLSVLNLLLLGLGG